MNRDELLAIIAAAGGNDYVAGFIFDNSGRRFFTTTEPWDPATMLDPTAEIMHFTEKDLTGGEYVVWKLIQQIQTVVTVKDPADRDKIDTRYIGG